MSAAPSGSTPIAGKRLPQDLTDAQLAELRIDEVRCTGCTPCCTQHANFLHRGNVLWACQEKLRQRKSACTKSRQGEPKTDQREGDAR